MIGTGWEFWGLKFAWFLILLTVGTMFLIIRLTMHRNDKIHHIDTMAGDEGED